jgi:hypothetical protein
LRYVILHAIERAAVSGPSGVGARHLLCSSHSFELEIRLHHPHRFLNPDYSVFDCGGVALSEDKVSFSWEGDRSGLGGSSVTRKLCALPIAPWKLDSFRLADYLTFDLRIGI